METNIASCNFTKYIKRGPNRWQHCPVVRGKTGRVKQDLVLVDGRIEHHPEGYYSFDWREGGRRRRRALGKDAPAAQLALERHVATERAPAQWAYMSPTTGVRPVSAWSRPARSSWTRLACSARQDVQTVPDGTGLLSGELRQASTRPN